MLRAALYDLDGLMVDSEPLHGQASELALNRYGHTHAGIPEAVRRGFYGKRVVDVAGEIVAVLGLPVTPARWAQERQRIFLELVERGIELMPGMIESLDLFDRRGMRKAVVSSGERRYVRRILQLTGLGDRFDQVVTGDDVTHGKPDPECYLLAAARLEVAPAECLVLEDAQAGMLAGRRAGMRVIGIENLFNDRFDHADIVLRQLGEIDEPVLARLEQASGERPLPAGEG